MIPLATRRGRRDWVPGLWQGLIAQVLAEQPQCQLQQPGCTSRSTTYHYLVDLLEYPEKALDRRSVIATCLSCKTIAEQPTPTTPSAA